MPELVYSPWATDEHLAATGSKAKSLAHRSGTVCQRHPRGDHGAEIGVQAGGGKCRQTVQKPPASPVDPETRKTRAPADVLKRGALVHFAVSQYEVYMTTPAAGRRHLVPCHSTREQRTAVPETMRLGISTDMPRNTCGTRCCLPENLLTILGRYIHLEIEEKEGWDGRKYRKETMIFPRYHQWDVVNKLIAAARSEGPGNKYLIQHSAGSGKSNSIAWTAHQLSALHTAEGNKRFDSVIIVTDRNVLDAQLQDTIYQFEHVDGVVGRINRDEGEGSKSEQLADALTHSQPIIIVTIQTFPFVLTAIEADVNLKERHYAVIADEAHSSQTGSTARKLKEVLMIEGHIGEGEELTADDILDATVASRRASPNLSYFAFTATPKTRTLELFGRLPNPAEVPSRKNIPHCVSCLFPCARPSRKGLFSMC